MKRELKDVLHHYLGTGLKYLQISKGNFSCDVNVSEIKTMDLNNMNDLLRKRYHVISCTPCFLPMSALTEPMEAGTVPLIELSKLTNASTDLNNPTSRKLIYDNGFFY
jgi:hypothetical protein